MGVSSVSNCSSSEVSEWSLGVLIVHRIPLLVCLSAGRALLGQLVCLSTGRALLGQLGQVQSGRYLYPYSVVVLLRDLVLI